MFIKEAGIFFFKILKVFCQFLTMRENESLFKFFFNIFNDFEIETFFPEKGIKEFNKEIPSPTW